MKVEILKKIKNNHLMIGLISTPFFQVPPSSYGGLEMVVWDLACGLDELGHEVTIFGPQGSSCPPHGHLVEICESNNTVNVDWFKLEKQNYEVYKDLIDDKKFDVIHDNTWFAFPYLLKQKYPQLKILHLHHGGFNWDSIPPFGKPNLVAISQFMQNYTIQYFKQKGYNVGCSFVRNGINLERYPFDPNIVKTQNLLFVGRYSSFKHPDWAIEVAKKTDHEIDLIGGSFVDSVDYLNHIGLMCDSIDAGVGKIRMWKDVSHDFKIKKMQEAKTILIPSKMGEPLNLVSIEGQACGTCMIALADGGLPETIVNGKTGFICNNIDEMVDIIKKNKVDTIKSEDCRKHIESNFSRLVMAKGYEKLYYKILKGEEW